jgi:hypothetical protein
MIDQSKVHEICYQHLVNVSITANGGVWARCPFCGDSKKSKKIKRFHLDYYGKYDEWVFKCYNGGCNPGTGNIFTLYAFVKGISQKEAYRELVDPVYNEDTIRKRLSTVTASPIIEEDVKNNFLDIDLKNDCISLSSETTTKIDERYQEVLRRFVTRRKVPIEAYIAVRGRYKNRIILPLWIHGKLEYFQARKIFDEMEPKFLNPVVDKRSIVLNIDNFDRDKFIIITEGLLDAYMVNYDQGTTVLGGCYKDEFINLLLPHTDRGVIIAPDNIKIDKTGSEEIKKFVTNSTYRHSKLVQYFLMPYNNVKDLNELVMKKDIDNVYDFILKNTNNSFKFLTKVKLNTSY